MRKAPVAGGLVGGSQPFPISPSQTSPACPCGTGTPCPSWLSPDRSLNIGLLALRKVFVGYNRYDDSHQVGKDIAWIGRFNIAHGNACWHAKLKFAFGKLLTNREI